jgi:hypothetical protein
MSVTCLTRAVVPYAEPEKSKDESDMSSEWYALSV